MAVSPLADLIEETQQRFLDTYGVQLRPADIVRRSGGGLKTQRLSQIMSTPLRAMPSPGTLAALATGLGVPEALVVERALASAGYGDWGLAARRGVPLQVRRDAAAADDNVDAPAGDDPA